MLENELHNRACFMSHMGEYMMKEDLFLSMSSLILNGGFKFPDNAILPDIKESTNLGGKSTGEDRTEQLSNGILIVPISGPRMLKPSKHGGTGTLLLRKITKDAMVDPNVKGMMLKLRTPGGHVEGNHKAALVLKEFAQVKPLFSHTEEMMASAGVWLGLQASRVSASPMATVGSLGTLSVIHDFSKRFEMQGVEAHVISTGKFKGMGTPGSKITKEHLAFFQNRANELNAFFKAAVMEARGFSKEKTDLLFDGSFGLAAKAKADGLIDEVETFEQALSALEEQIKDPQSLTTITTQNQNPEKNKNSLDQPLPTSATMDEEIKQNSQKENEDMEEIKNKAELKSAYPVMCAELEQAAVSKALEEEQNRVNDWAAYADVDPVAVKAGIESGKAIRVPEATSLQAKRSDPAFQAALAAESAKTPETPAADASATATEKEASEKEVNEIIANAEKYN